MNVILRIADQEKVIAALDSLDDRVRDLRRPLADFGERMVRKIAKRLSGPALKERTGRLKGSLAHEETPDTAEISAGGADDVDYAAIHHFGGTIRPKKKKFLTIPFPGGPADQRVPMRAADFNDTFVAKGIIFRTIGRDNIEPLFILKKSVKIEARPYMYEEESDIVYLKESIADFIAGAWS